MPDVVRAAGGVLYRPANGGAGDGIEVCLVHRQRYDDWSLPKGHLDQGEHPLLAATREVAEETGVRGLPQLRMRQSEYILPDGTPKSVEFWLMRASDDALDPVDTKEVDQAVWLPAAEAAERVTYEDDQTLIKTAAALPSITAVAGLVRHANAGERKKWHGNDSLRPVDDIGLAQSEEIAGLYALLAPARLYAATPLRCKQTLEPLASALDEMPIVLDSAFAEPPEAEDAPAKAKLAAARLLELRDGGVPVICSQGKIIPHLLADLHGADDPAPYKTRKGGGWVLTWSGERLLGLSRLL